MSKKSGIIVVDREEKTHSKRKTKKDIEYKSFEQLTLKEKKYVELYEKKFAYIHRKKADAITSQWVIKRYKDCFFPPFVLNTMKLIVDSDK